MAMTIQMGKDTKISIANGNMKALRELLVTERNTKTAKLVEFVDPSAVRLSQGAIQQLNAIIEILPE